MAFLKKLLKRLLLLALILAVLGVAAFTWFAYWPLESSQGPVEDLVPGSAEFLVRTTWREIEESGFLERNLTEQPLVPELEGVFERHVRPLLDRLTREQALINAQIPLGLTTFSFEDDVVPGEVVIAGRWCRDVGPPSPPLYREIMVLTRVSWKVKVALAALQHGFVRDRVRQSSGIEIAPTEEPAVLRLTLPDVRVSTAYARSRCGDGFTIPPENQWLLARVRDVLVLSNSEHLIGRAVDLGREGAGGEAFSSRPGFNLSAPEGSVAAAVDVLTLRPYLTRALDYGGNRTRLFKYFLPIEALDRMNGHLELVSPDLLAGRSTMRLEWRGLMESLRENYRGPGLDLRAGPAAFLPAQDTFALVQLNTDPMHMLNALYDGIINDEMRRLWRDNLRESRQYQTMDAFFRDVSRYLGQTTAIALGRLSTLYDAGRWPTFESADKDRPSRADPALAVIVTLRQGAKQSEVDAFLADRVHLIGFDKNLERVDHKGFTYTRLKFFQYKDAADLQLVRPAYILVQDRLVLASHEDYLKTILDVYADPRANPPLSEDPTYRTTMATLPAQGHLAVFVDLEKLSRVPAAAPNPAQEADPAGGPRGWLWDRRNDWVWVAKDPRAKAIEFREELKQRLGGVPASQAQSQAIEEQVAQRKQGWMERYPEFLEEYRRQLMGYRRLRGLAAVLSAQGAEVLRAEAVLLLRPAEADPKGPSGPP